MKIIDSSYRAGFQEDVLDGVRGLAVLIVLMSHAANKGILWGPVNELFGGGSGQYGVYLFFTLSSFLLVRSLLRKNNQDLKNRKIWLEYFFRRLLRIYPLYVVVLLFVCFSTLMDWKLFYCFGLGDFGEHLMLGGG